MNRIFALIVGLSLTLIGSASQASEICDTATEEFDAAVEVYKSGTATDFIQRILKNGPLEDDTRSLGQAQSLTQIEQFFGAFQSASVLSTKPLGQRSCYVIGILEYENGPAFAVANYYRAERGVGTTSMFFQTEPETILPKQFLVD